MSDLVEFLRARLDEDEAAQQPFAWDDIGLGERYGSIYEAPGGGWHMQPCAYRMVEHGEDCVCGLPVRMLAEVAAKRALIRPHGFKRINGDGDALCKGHDTPTLYPCRTLLTIARPYADHPDFDPAWRALG